MEPLLLYFESSVGKGRAETPGTGQPVVRVVTTMNMIQPNCRVQFAAEDVEFILSVLGQKIGTAECLIQLLSDEGSRDLILDDEALFHACWNGGVACGFRAASIFTFSCVMFFGAPEIENRAVADYVAEVLAEFASAERSRCVVPGQANPLDYFFEMLSALQTADDRTSFYIRAHIGNYSLFLSGVFPERIRFRAEARGFPDVKYYEGLGRTHYRVASDHRLAQRYELPKSSIRYRSGLKPRASH